jgi:glycosyltransferase involved in cell wall biosynthesis
MRIGVNARLLLSNNMEGMSRYIYETTACMARLHPEHQFILFYDRYHHAKFDFPGNVSHVVVPLPTRHPVLWYIWFEIFLPVLFSIYKIDFFYSGDGFMSVRTKIPTVLVLHDLAYLHYPAHLSRSILDFYKKYTPLYLQKAKHIITVSQYVKNDICAHFDIERDKVTVAYNAVNGHEEKQHEAVRDDIKNLTAKNPYFIYVGSLHPRKNIVGLIRAFDCFNSNQNYAFNLILAGRLAWKTKEITQEISNHGHVKYIGIVNESEKKLLLKQATALTYVSLLEGFGIPILEAMLQGTPVITSSKTSMPEVAGNAALLVDPNNIYEVADGMKKIATDECLRQSLIINGKERVKYFDGPVSAEKIFKVLV